MPLHKLSTEESQRQIKRYLVGLQICGCHEGHSLELLADWRCLQQIALDLQHHNSYDYPAEVVPAPQRLT